LSMFYSIITENTKPMSPNNTTWNYDVHTYLQKYKEDREPLIEKEVPHENHWNALHDATPALMSWCLKALRS